MKRPAFGLAGRHIIMLLLVLLVALFLGGMWLLSGLNLRIAESSLTGLPNRAPLLADLEGQKPGALVLVNADGFKQFNGVFGQACGDQVIRHLAARAVGP